MTRQAALEMLLERVQRARAQGRGQRAPVPAVRLDAAAPRPAAPESSPLRAAVAAAVGGVVKQVVAAKIAERQAVPLQGDRKARLETLLARVASRRRSR